MRLDFGGVIVSTYVAKGKKNTKIDRGNEVEGIE